MRGQIRRGMLELDILFERFLQKEYPLLSEAEKAQFSEFLALPDAVIWSWLFGSDEPDEQYLALIARIKG